MREYGKETLTHSFDRAAQPAFKLRNQGVKPAKGHVKFYSRRQYSVMSIHIDDVVVNEESEVGTTTIPCREGNVARGLFQARCFITISSRTLCA